MKKTANNCYYLGTIEISKNVLQSYYWNEITKKLQMWHNENGLDILLKELPFENLPKEFEDLFDDKKSIIIDRDSVLSIPLKQKIPGYY